MGDGGYYALCSKTVHGLPLGETDLQPTHETAGNGDIRALQVELLYHIDQCYAN